MRWRSSSGLRSRRNRPRKWSRAPMSRDRKIDYRGAGVTEPPLPTWWRQRGIVAAAWAVLLILLIVVFAGTSAPIVVSALAVDGFLLGAWLLSACGYGSALLPLPLRERAGVRGKLVESPREVTSTDAT